MRAVCWRYLLPQMSVHQILLFKSLAPFIWVLLVPSLEMKRILHQIWVVRPSSFLLGRDGHLDANGLCSWECYHSICADVVAGLRKAIGMCPLVSH